MGVIVFALVIVIFYAILSSNEEVKTEDLTDKANTVAARLFEDTSLGLINSENQLDDAVFLTLAQTEYDQLKADLGITTGDFCIFLEAADGSLVVVSDYTGIGNPEFEIGTCPCGINISGCQP